LFVRNCLEYRKKVNGPDILFSFENIVASPRPKHKGFRTLDISI